MGQSSRVQLALGPKTTMLGGKYGRGGAGEEDMVEQLVVMEADPIVRTKERAAKRSKGKDCQVKGVMDAGDGDDDEDEDEGYGGAFISGGIRIRIRSRLGASGFNSRDPGYGTAPQSSHRQMVRHTGCDEIVATQGCAALHVGAWQFGGGEGEVELRRDVVGMPGAKRSRIRLHSRIELARIRLPRCPIGLCRSSPPCSPLARRSQNVKLEDGTFADSSIATVLSNTRADRCLEKTWAGRGSMACAEDDCTMVVCQLHPGGSRLKAPPTSGLRG